MSSARVYIVLATYQGETWLPELLQSIQAQSHSDWTLLVRDDGSSDATRQILGDAAQQDRRIVIAQTTARGGARWAIFPGSCSRPGTTGPTMSCWPIRTTSGTRTKSPGSCRPCRRPKSGADQRRPATGLLRCGGGRCRAAAAACLVPPPEPAALWFRPAAEDAAGPQLRAGLRLCRESGAPGTRLAAARDGGFARLVAGPLRGDGGPDHVPRRAAAGVSPSRGERQPGGLLERVAHGPAAWRRRWADRLEDTSCDRSNRPRPSATVCASGTSLPAKRANCSRPSAGSWNSLTAGGGSGSCIAWACRRSIGRGGCCSMPVCCVWGRMDLRAVEVGSLFRPTSA